MENAITREEIKTTLAVFYRQGYDEMHRLDDEATAAIHDGDDEAFKAITRRARKKSDFTDGIKTAALLLGIGEAEFMDAVNADRPTEGQDT